MLINTVENAIFNTLDSSCFSKMTLANKKTTWVPCTSWMYPQLMKFSFIDSTFLNYLYSAIKWIRVLFFLAISFLQVLKQRSIYHTMHKLLKSSVLLDTCEAISDKQSTRIWGHVSSGCSLLRQDSTCVLPSERRSTTTFLFIEKTTQCFQQSLHWQKT